MPWLLLSVVALIVGPLFASPVRRRPWLYGLLDGFVLVMISGVCVLHLIPEAVERLGMVALLLAAAGTLVPYMLEGSLRRLGQGTHLLIFASGVSALLLHAVLDGFALSVATDARVALPIVLHRLPIGFFLWWTLAGRNGRGMAIAALALLAGGTVAGAFGAGALLENAGPILPVIQSLLAGSLLHILFHHADEEAERKDVRRAGALGAVVGVFALSFLGTEEHSHSGLGMLQPLERLFVASAGPILLGFLGAGLLTLVSSKTVARLMTGSNALGSAVRGVVYGLPLPICSCGVVPMYQSLIRAGVPPAAGLAFLVATPELGVDAVLLSLPLLGPWLTGARVLMAFVVALVVGILVGRKIPALEIPEPDGPCEEGCETNESAGGLMAGLRYAFVDMVDHLGPWILAGIVAAAALEPVLEPDVIAQIPDSLQVFALVVLSAPAYVCASAATPVAAVLVSKGVSLGAVLAFLIAGPATNVTTFGLLSGIHGRKTAIKAIGAITVASLFLGLLADLLIPATAIGALSVSEHEHGALSLLAAAVFGLLLIASLFRIGPRGVLAQLGLAHGHDHEHGEHEHEEGRGQPGCSGIGGESGAAAEDCSAVVEPAREPCS